MFCETAFLAKTALYRTYSVRQKIREGAPGYVITADLLPNFLHACGAQGRRAIDQNNLEKGLFYSKFLVKVIQPRCYPQ